MYIKGLGFINDNNYQVNATNNINKTTANTVTNTAKASFEEMLSTETAKLNEKDSTNTYDLKSIFKEASERYGVSYDLLTSIAWHESRFQPDVTSSAGAMGLMQLMPSTAKAMGVENAYDPYQNVMGAAKLLSNLSKMYNGDLKLTLAAYAAGTGSVAKYNGIPPYGETREFVSTISSMVENGSVEVPDQSVSSKPLNYTQFTQTSLIPSAQNESQIYKNSIYSDSLYKNGNLDKILSYSEYQLLMSYYEHMLDIISNSFSTEENDASLF